MILRNTNLKRPEKPAHKRFVAFPFCLFLKKPLSIARDTIYIFTRHGGTFAGTNPKSKKRKWPPSARKGKGAATGMKVWMFKMRNSQNRGIQTKAQTANYYTP
jgi:hypothetical protein